MADCAKPSGSREVLMPKESASPSVSRTMLLLIGVPSSPKTVRINASTGNAAGSAMPSTRQRAPKRRSSASKAIFTKNAVTTIRTASSSSNL